MRFYIDSSPAPSPPRLQGAPDAVAAACAPLCIPVSNSVVVCIWQSLRFFLQFFSHIGFFLYFPLSCVVENVEVEVSFPEATRTNYSGNRLLCGKCFYSDLAGRDDDRSC